MRILVAVQIVILIFQVFQGAIFLLVRSDVHRLLIDDLPKDAFQLDYMLSLFRNTNLLIHLQLALRVLRVHIVSSSSMIDRKLHFNSRIRVFAAIRL